MPRSTDEQLQVWAAPFVSSEPGSCDWAAKELSYRVVRLRATPTPKLVIETVMVKGAHQDHKAVSLTWSDEPEALMVDPTISQFYKAGRDDARPQIFIGSYTEWTAELSRLHDGAMVEKFVGNTSTSSIYATLEEESGASAVTREQRRHSSGRTNKEIHEAKVLRRGCTLF